MGNFASLAERGFICFFLLPAGGVLPQTPLTLTDQRRSLAIASAADSDDAISDADSATDLDSAAEYVRARAEFDLVGVLSKVC